MTYTREQFEDGSCPNCGSEDIKEDGNPVNFAFLNGLGYFLNFPFGADHKCNDCGANNDEDACFVATAIYGDSKAPQVNALRIFRDSVLNKNYFGKRFTDFYYSGAGKSTAEFVRTHMHSSIPLIRKCLDAVVRRMQRK